MEYETNGLMATKQPNKRTTRPDRVPKQPSSTTGTDAGTTAGSITDSERAFLMTMAKMVQLSMQMRIGSGDRSKVL